MVPGHIMPTEKPQMAHPASETNGWGSNEIRRYEAMHNAQLKIMKLL